LQGHDLDGVACGFGRTGLFMDVAHRRRL
jgi:adenosylmethionine-8-amino-7-oxononanoate aminotransferase